MNDFISRQTAIDAINALHDLPNAWLDYAVEAVIALPTEQTERKKGKWTHEDCHAMTYKYCCSNCKAHHRAMYDYCPSCGAEMKKEVEE